MSGKVDSINFYPQSYNHNSISTFAEVLRISLLIEKYIHSKIYFEEITDMKY